MMVVLGVAMLGRVDAAPFAYIADGSAPKLYVVDTATDEVVTTVTIGTSPSGVAVNPAGTRVYVTNTTASSVSVINTATNLVIATVPVGNSPQGVAVSPNGARVYVANGSSNTVSVIDTGTNTVVATITPGAGSQAPVGVTVNPAGTRLYIANRIKGTVSVVDTATNAILTTITLPANSQPQDLRVTPNGTRLYVTEISASNRVYAINTATNTVAATIPVGNSPRSLAINAAGTTVYVATEAGMDTSGFLAAINTANNLVGSYIDTAGAGPIGVALTPSGARLYVTNYWSSYVSVINTANGQAVNLIAAGARPSGIAIGPSGYTVTAIAGANGSLTCVSPVIFGQTSSCTATPSAGYRTTTISGCGGVATGVGSNGYTTGAISGNCTVNATFELLPVDAGACGSADGVATLTTPNANLCSVGSASNVTINTANFTWTCTGSTVASCSAPRQYTVTASAGANGTLDCTNPVLAGQTSSCTATPAGGYRTVSISGCGGVATGPSVNAYVTAAVNANCTVSASFEIVPVVPGACGTSNNVATVTAPTANLCSAGVATSVLTNTSSFDWTCSGSGGAGAATCVAPRQYTVTANAGANGALDCASPVVAGSTAGCSATPDAGYRTLSIAGCGGQATGPAIDLYVTGAIIANCAVTASFEIAPVASVPPLAVPALDYRSLGLLTLLLLSVAGVSLRVGRRR